MTVLAFDLGGTNLRMAAVERAGNIIFHHRRDTPNAGDGENIVRAIVEAAEICRQNLPDRHIEKIAAAVPATVQSKRGLIIKAPNLPALDNFPLVEILSEKLNLAVYLENDANAAAIGENWLGAERNARNSIMVTLGTGVGGGIIIDGEIIRGADGTAGEIGHICVEPFGNKCGCGSRGCLEQYASATALVRQSKELMNEFPRSSLIGESDLTAAKIYAAGKGGDRLATEVFRRQGFYLGIALAGLINTLNPEIIVIGGGAAAGWDLFLPSLNSEISARAYREPVKRAKIVRAALGDEAGILGAAKIAFDDARQ